MFLQKNPFFHWLSLFILTTLVCSFQSLRAAPSALRGNLGVHDPSTATLCNGRYYVFFTGYGISSKSSADLKYWSAGPRVFSSPPSWTTTAVPGFRGNFWAPDVIYFNGLYHLYYAVSTFGSQVSAIGMATNPTLDPSDPNYHWTDQGPVIQSTTGDAYNCIDPCPCFDASSNLWMSFGSFWNGIYMVRLDPSTGLLYSTPTLTHLAVNNASGDPIEASYLYHHGSYYYLFANWGLCCRGIDSTYNIRVGRSSSITGPYLDRNGVNMVFGGGTLFLKTTGKFIGPGQTGILDANGKYYFGYHYYDADNNGASMYDLEPLTWTADGWPAFTNDWSAIYRFQMDAADDNGQYYGLMQNGASIRTDPLLGKNVLNLNGTSQYVSLPWGAANARTFIAVFKWNGGVVWQRVFDFGRDTNSYAFFTPESGSGTMRFAITTSGPGGEQQLNAPAAAPVGSWTQVAVTTDGSQGILYVNGTPVATNNSMSLTVPDIAPINNWFGRSQFPLDPYFNGQISSVRLFGRALTPAEIVAPQPRITSPTTESNYQPGSAIQFAGAATDFADVPLSAADLTWTVEFYGASGTNVVFGPIAGITGGSYSVPNDPTVTNGFYRVLLSVTDGAGHTASNSVDVLPGPADSTWAASYPFDNGAVDANGNFNGTLVNGASTVSDSVRGSVLNLSGSSQYVSLPAGVGAMRTFSAWVKWNGGNTWQRIFDFGTGTTSYAMLTAEANNGALRFEITPDNGGAIWHLDAPNSLPVGVWTHVAVTLNGREAVMYVNGQAVAVNAGVYVLPSDVAGSQNYLGRSQFSTDPYFNGQLDSVQISSQTLSAEQITASSIALSGGPASLMLNWPAFNNGLELYSSPGLGSGAAWTRVAGTPTATNGISFLSLTPANNSTFFRLQTP